MIDYETATRLDVIEDALRSASEHSQIASFSARAKRIEMALRKWELHRAEQSCYRLEELIYG